MLSCLITVHSWPHRQEEVAERQRAELKRMHEEQLEKEREEIRRAAAEVAEHKAMLRRQQEV